MRLIRSNTAESVAYTTLLIAAVLAARIWFADLRIVGFIRFDVAIVGLSLLAIERGTTFGIVAGFVLGIFTDAVNPGWMGVSSIGYAIVGFFSGSFGQTLYMDKSTARGLLVMGAVVIFDLIYGLLTIGIASPFWSAVGGTLGSAVVSGGITILITRALKQWRSASSEDAELVGDG